MLKETPFAIECDEFVSGIFRMLGNVNGETCGCWQHAAAQSLVSLCPWKKKATLHDTGEKIAKAFMDSGHKRSYAVNPADIAKEVRPPEGAKSTA
jgi:hypothetical protein